jgi:hypothetical protein
MLPLTPLSIRLAEDIAHRIGLVTDQIAGATWGHTEQTIDTVLDVEDGPLARLATLMATASNRAQHFGAEDRATRYARLVNDLQDLLLDYDAAIPQPTPAVPTPVLAAAATAAAARRGR